MHPIHEYWHTYITFNPLYQTLGALASRQHPPKHIALIIMIYSIVQTPVLRAKGYTVNKIIHISNTASFFITVSLRSFSSDVSYLVSFYNLLSDVYAPSAIITVKQYSAAYP